MERIKTKIIIAVTERLREASDTEAKTDLIEELSENLYQRYLDLTASGVEENEAFRRAMEDLGDVSELLEYLESEETEQQAQESRTKDHFNDFLRGMEDVIRETITQTKDAMDQAKIITRDIAKKFNEKYPEGLQVHCGYDKEKGGFFWESNGKGRPVEGTRVAAETVRALDVQLHNGDVTVSVVEQDEIEVNGDAEELEVRLSDDGVLYVRQGKTASSSALFGRGLARTDVELILPVKAWEIIEIHTVNGDVFLDDMLEADELRIRTESGDITADRACSPHMTLKTCSGDISGNDMTGNLVAESKSGDITLDGSFVEVSAASLSGDVNLDGSAELIHLSSTSGDVTVHTALLPREMELDSKSGDCSAHIPGGEGFAVSLHTVSGDLNTDFELVGTIGRKSGGAVYLDGGNRQYSLSSTSGDIALKKI